MTINLLSHLKQKLLSSFTKILLEHSGIFCATKGEEAECESSSRPISVGRLNIGQRYTAGVEQPDEGAEKQETFKVRKLKKDIWSNSSEVKEQELCGEQVQLRGARKINKGKSERTLTKYAVLCTVVSSVIIDCYCNC